MVGSSGYSLDQPTSSSRDSVVVEQNGNYKHKSDAMTAVSPTNGHLPSNGDLKQDDTKLKADGNGIYDTVTDDVTSTTSSSSADNDEKKKKKSEKPPMVGLAELVSILLYFSNTFLHKSAFANLNNIAVVTWNILHGPDGTVVTESCAKQIPDLTFQKGS